MAEKKPTLAEACSPFFLYLVTFRRNAETSNLDVQGLQEALQGGIEFIGTSCESDPDLLRQFERIWYALVATADQVVLSSSWHHRATWSMTLLESHYFHSFEGGSKFFRIVKEVLDDTGQDAPHLAAVLFTCMGLGFQGELLGERRELERLRTRLFEKSRLAGSMGGHLSPAAYGRNSNLSVVKLPTVGILRLTAVALGAVLFALLAGDAVTEYKNSTVTDRIEDLIEGLRKEGK
jgi:type IV/VI secretion system ImpK/VasF family protein